MRGMTDNLDFLAARLHGRRSRMATGERLATLCQVRTVPRFGTEVLSVAEVLSATQIQRRLVEELAQEMAGLAAQVVSTGAELLRWLAVRFQVENLKVLLRGMLAGERLESLQPHLVPLPREFTLDAASLAGARSLDEFHLLVPRGPLRRRFGETVEVHGDEKRPFFFESALDKGYFEELLARTGALGAEERELVKPLVLQEIDTFHLMLVARGKYIYGLAATALLPLHVSGTAIPRERFAAMLADADLRTAASRALNRAVDSLPGAAGAGGDPAGVIAPSDLEALAWNRFLRLANRAFRRSHMGFAAVVAFVELRRVEVANLVTLSEGIRAQIPAEKIRDRLIPRQTGEVAHV